MKKGRMLYQKLCDPSESVGCYRLRARTTPKRLRRLGAALLAATFVLGSNTAFSAGRETPGPRVGLETRLFELVKLKRTEAKPGIGYGVLPVLLSDPVLDRASAEAMALIPIGCKGGSYPAPTDPPGWYIESKLQCVYDDIGDNTTISWFSSGQIWEPYTHLAITIRQETSSEGFGLYMIVMTYGVKVAGPTTTVPPVTATPAKGVFNPNYVNPTVPQVTRSSIAVTLPPPIITDAAATTTTAETTTTMPAALVATTNEATTSTTVKSGSKLESSTISTMAPSTSPASSTTAVHRVTTNTSAILASPPAARSVSKGALKTPKKAIGFRVKSKKK